MKKIQILTSAAAILLALAGPSLAASRTHRAVDPYASGVNRSGAADAYASGADRSGAYYYGPIGGEARTPEQFMYETAPVRGGTLPYSDRPYGDPNRW
jgi:hypothetical protein